MSDQPYVPTFQEPEPGAGNSQEAEQKSDRLLWPRWWAWWLDFFAYMVVQVVAGGIVGSPRFFIKALSGEEWISQLGFSLAAVFIAFIWGVKFRTPGFVLMKLEYRKPSNLHWAWWLRSSRFLGLPIIFFFGGIATALRKLELFAGTEVTAMLLGGIPFYVALIGMIVSAFVCLSRSGLSPLDRVFDMRIIRKNQTAPPSTSK